MRDPVPAAARILIVDDEPSAVRLLELVLRTAGYTNVSCARDADQALTLFGEFQPDLVLLDRHLGTADGLDVLKRLRHRGPGGPDVPVLMLTADPSRELLRQALAAGAKDVLRKPFDAEELLLRMRNLLETRFLHRALEARTEAVTRAAAVAVSGVMADLVSEPDVLTAAERVASTVRTLLHAESSSVYRLDPDTGDVVAQAFAGTASMTGPTARMPHGTGIVGRAIQTGRPVISHDLLNDPAIAFPEDARAFLRERGVTSAIAVPLIVSGRVIGALALAGGPERKFGARDVDQAQAFASQAAIALELASVHAATDRARQAAEELARVARRLTETLDEAAIGQQVVTAATSIFQAQTCTLRLLRDGEVLRLLATGGPTRHTMELPEELPAGAGIPALVLKSGEPFWTPDALLDARIPMTAALRDGLRSSPTRSVLAVPLRARGANTGVLAIAAETGRRFSDAQVRLLQILADQVAVALDNAAQHKALQHAYDQLSLTHAQLTQAQKLESIGQLAGGVAHDLNNLLSVVIGRGMLLLGAMPASAPERPSLQMMVTSAERGAGVVKQLLTFSRRQPVNVRTLELNRVVADIVPMLRRFIGEQIELVTRPAEPLGAVRADKAQIDQVIMNLVINARDAMPSGGRITIETADVEPGEEPVEGHVGGGRGPHVMLAVTDTGTGMDPATQARIFDPFFTTKEPGLGTGLGLATVYGIVQQSGGAISVRSAPGEGTTFRIYLPRVARKTEAPEAAPAQPVHGSETVLVAEDEDEIRVLVREVLQTFGYSVLEAARPADALTIVEGHDGPIHLLLTDVIMPQLDGRQLAERVMQLRPGVRVLYMSGYSGDAIMRQGRLEAGTEYLQKPFTPAALAARVREVLDAPR